MKCNYCGKGTGRNYTKGKDGKNYYYFCQECVGIFRCDLLPFDFKKDLSFLLGWASSSINSWLMPPVSEQGRKLGERLEEIVKKYGFKRDKHGEIIKIEEGGVGTNDHLSIL